MAGKGHGRALPLAARIVDPLRQRAELADAIEHFRRAATTAHSDAQVLDLLADAVVRPLDRLAYQAVSRASRDVGLGVTMSPFGLLDAGIVVWRGLRMVREVAAVYGFRPGVFAHWGLVRRILYAAATQGAADFVADALLSHVGARLAGLLSARVGEGVLSGHAHGTARHHHHGGVPAAAIPGAGQSLHRPARHRGDERAREHRPALLR
ncbi:MAG: DUF697 domain-containing protein [Alphaproteobacteria bacterium]|nr:DUF697 domain-containing protein [Alphaproteobacteria bacterium]